MVGGCLPYSFPFLGPCGPKVSKHWRLSCRMRLMGCGAYRGGALVGLRRNPRGLCPTSPSAKCCARRSHPLPSFWSVTVLQSPGPAAHMPHQSAGKKTVSAHPFWYWSGDRSTLRWMEQREPMHSFGVAALGPSQACQPVPAPLGHMCQSMSLHFDKGGASSRVVPKRAVFFWCLGAALRFWGRLQPNPRRLQPTAVSWRPTAVGLGPTAVCCSSSSISVGAVVDPHITRAGGFYFNFS